MIHHIASRQTGQAALQPGSRLWPRSEPPQKRPNDLLCMHEASRLASLSQTIKKKQSPQPTHHDPLGLAQPPPTTPHHQIPKIPIACENKLMLAPQLSTDEAEIVCHTRARPPHAACSQALKKGSTPVPAALLGDPTFRRSPCGGCLRLTLSCDPPKRFRV